MATLTAATLPRWTTPSVAHSSHARRSARGLTKAMSSLQASAGFVPKLIASDVDGTLLRSDQMLSPAVKEAVLSAAAAGIPMVLATGKARGPWTKKVFPQIGLPMPGVYLQGCLIYDKDGDLLFSRELQEDICRDLISFAAAESLTLTAYCGERILTEATDVHTDRLLFYEEPTPEGVGPMTAILGKIPVQKMILMAEQSRIEEIRPAVATLMEGRATLTTALTGMLEILPLGASKGDGVSKLLDILGVAAENVMAMGDGENDVEMLEMAGWGVAMGNAGPHAREVADAVVASNDEDGVAEAINKYVLEPLKAAAPPA
eukprot:jgi/Tetstr1/444111/TSEL_032010.t1